MTRGWRIVLTIVVILFAAGCVLLGAGWLTGASSVRILELLFGGRAGFDEWTATMLTRAKAVATAVGELVAGLF